MTVRTESAAEFVLRSTYDPSPDSVSLDLTVGPAGLPGAARLALTSVIQLTPTAGKASLLVHRLASYHEFAISEQALAAGDRWTLGGLTPGHRPQHSNDGPVSAFVILPDDSTLPVTVTPMQRAGDPTESTATATATATTAESDSEPEIPAIVPYPTSVEIADETPLTAGTAHLSGDHPVARQAWDAVSALEHRTQADPRLHPGEGVAVTAVDDPELGAEAYCLTVESGQVTVAASGATGFRHAFITLARWLPAGLPRRGRIDDHPKYPWRGVHIDLARQWFEPDVVERLIDIAAWRKLSRLHLHLTDDEAWRLPIEGYPELATTGATRGYGLPLEPMLGGTAQASGRAYTTAEIASWVERADQLGITLVPEVDLPAHNHAALTTLPQLRDPDERSGAISVQFFTDNVLVPGHDLLPDLLDRVVDSVAALFPSSPWIHIGGDEVPEGAWAGSPIVAAYRAEHGLATTRDVEAAFHRELATKVRSRTGRRLGAWQEAAESGGMQPDDGYVVGWRTPGASRRLAADGYDVVVAPGQAYYLDMAIDDRWDQPGACWAGTVSLDDVCRFVPDEGWTEHERSHLLGIQACLWTEHVTSEDLLHRMLLPRLDAVAERAWTGEIVGGSSSLLRRAAERR